MQGNKTHEELLRKLERKDDLPKPTEMDNIAAQQEQTEGRTAQHGEARQSEFSVSRGGMNQESRGHNKHNNPGQEGHKPQQHSPAEQKN